MGGEQGWLQGRGPDHMVLGPIHGAASMLSWDGSSRILKGEGHQPHYEGGARAERRGWERAAQAGQTPQPATDQAPPAARCLSGVCVCVTE